MKTEWNTSDEWTAVLDAIRDEETAGFELDAFVHAIQIDTLQAARDVCWNESEDHDYHWIPENRGCAGMIDELIAKVKAEAK